MKIEELKVIAAMTIKLTELRQNECKHLCIENAAPEIFVKLLREYENRNMVTMGTTGQITSLDK